MNIDKNTKICISISKFPGNVGATIHNTAYQFLNLNYVYLPIKVSNSLKALDAIRSLNIKGCSVSMPFKEEVISHLDEIEKDAKDIGAVNTILNNNGFLKGYNTDLYAVEWAINKININAYKPNLLILGFGGMGKACLKAVQNVLDINPIIAVRDLKKYKKNEHLEFVDWTDKENKSPNILINATPIGMNDKNEIPINLDLFPNLKCVIDVISQPKITKLKIETEKRNIKFISGLELAFKQAIKQFEIYTNNEAPEKIMWETLNNTYNS